MTEEEYAIADDEIIEKHVKELWTSLVPEPPAGWWKLEENDRKAVYDYIICGCKRLGEVYAFDVAELRRHEQHITWQVRGFIIGLLAINFILVLTLVLT